MTSSAPDWLTLIRASTDRFAEVVDTAEDSCGLAAPVASCPGWSIHDLVVHLGGVHQWAAHAVVAQHRDFQPEPVERGCARLADWYREHASNLVDVLTETSERAPAWTLDDQDRTAGFWRRRQVHETVRQVGLGRVEPLAWAVRMAATDRPGEVTLGDGEATEVRERAEVLLRLLWHRADASEVEDPRVIGLLSAALTP